MRVRCDLQGPEIRTGFLKDGQPIKLTTGKEITITTDYEAKGHEELIAMRYMLQPPEHHPINPSPYSLSCFMQAFCCLCKSVQHPSASRMRRSTVLWYTGRKQRLPWGTQWHAHSCLACAQLQEAAGGHEAGLSDPVRGWIHCYGGHQHRPQGRHSQGQVPQQRHSWVCP